MIIIGLTGSIGMGKSTVAAQFAALGGKICSADAIVHSLLEKDAGIITRIGKQFPEAIENGRINRKTLGKIVFSDQNKRAWLEAVLHPRVVRIEDRFIKKNRQLGARMVVMDIPLLFETGGEQRCDAVVVATAPVFIQKQRVMKRPGMTAEKFSKILATQVSDAAKRKSADFVVATGLGRAHSFRAVKTYMRSLGLA
ncbi:MAG: dephospho-CoA kinase [Alphaproteobacteria bacterium]